MSATEHILVVDDDGDVRDVLVDILRDRGYRVSLAVDGPSMREFLQDDAPVDAVVLDAAMPGEASVRGSIEAQGRNGLLLVAEWLYLDWASRAPQPLPTNFVYAEWITLHDNPNFRGSVDFLRTELDRVGPAHADLCRDFFSRAVALELSFFEAAYTRAEFS